MFPTNSSPSSSNASATWCGLIVATIAILFAGIAFAQKSALPQSASRPVGMQIVPIGGEPELRVDGVPFFVNAAQFDYFRVPQDLWVQSLNRYRELGINTIDIRIPWNWHEPADGQFDFDGHTNPRRDLRSLLRQITIMHFKLIVRPGPVIGDEWRNSGYPPWLLAYSNFKMSASNVQKGIPPPDAELATRDANAAAHSWLSNEMHMSYARRWLTAVAFELAPYAAKNSISITEPGDRAGETQEKQISGPLLFVALDSDMAIRSGVQTSELSRYLGELRGALVRGGLDAPSFVTVSNATVQGLPSSLGISSPLDLSPLGFAGEWFAQSPASSITTRSISASAPPAPHNSLVLTTTSTSSLKFLASSLGIQTDFPPFLSSFATTTFAGADDVRAVQSSPANMLLASRLLMSSGIRAMVYSPLQDTLTPAGWETTSAAQYYRWDSALDLAGNREARAIGVSRNGQFISTWGSMLASSHVSVDFGVVDLRACGEKTDQSASSGYTQELEQLFRVAALANFTPELVNPASQSVERLLRDRVIVLVLPGSDSHFQLLDKTQSALVEFVRRGGTLVYFPARPRGSLLEPLWRDSKAETGNVGGSALPKSGTDNDKKFDEWSFEQGHVIAAGNNFYSWVTLAESVEENRVQPQSSAAVESLTAIVEAAGSHRSLNTSANTKPDMNLVVSELVPNESPAVTGTARTCAAEQLCAGALVSVTNINPDNAADQSFEVIDPSTNVPRSVATQLDGTNVASPKISFNVTVPPLESLMLPVHAPLCAAVVAGEHCSDEVIVAGAELLEAERDGKTLELTFYAPVRAVVRLHLESEPSKVELDENMHLDDTWKQGSGELEVHLFRGAAPDYRRVLRLHMRYTPHVNEKSDREKTDRIKNNRRGSEYQVFDSLRFPLGTDATIPTDPPLISADANSGGSMIVMSQNYSDEIRSSDFTLDGAFHGTGSVRMLGEEQQFTRIRFQPNRNAPADASGQPTPEGLFRGSLAIRSDHQHATGPVLFVTPNEAGNSHYQFDFDRDGALEWVLESSRLRLIVSPDNGGRALALVDKSGGDNFITLGGALHDFIVFADTPPGQESALGDFSFNRSYHADWVQGEKDTSLRLTYQEHENSRAGIHVQKTLHFASPETIEASYRFSIVVPPAASSAPASEPQRSFISALSIPVSAPEDGSTQFCWQSSSPSERSTQAAASSIVSEAHCQDFTPSGSPISIPEGMRRLEIRYPGRHPLAIEFTAGRAVILPKIFSVQINFVIPFSSSSEASGEFTLRYTVGTGQ